MRFLIDHDFFAVTTRLLRSHGHEVVMTANELGEAQASDRRLLRLAQADMRILITRDRDYGALVSLDRLGSGVIYLRMSAATQAAVRDELLQVLHSHSEIELAEAYVVVEQDGHRFRKIGRTS